MLSKLKVKEEEVKKVTTVGFFSASGESLSLEIALGMTSIMQRKKEYYFSSHME